MGRSKLILVSLAGMFVLASSLYAQKPGTYSLVFNGYCDSATLTISPNGFVTGTHINYDCAGDNTWIDGVISLPIDRYDPEEVIGPVALADNIGELLFDGGADTLYLNFTTGTFSYYLETNGISPESYVNSGTISFVQDEVPAVSGNTPSWKRSTVAHAAAPELSIAGYPAGTYGVLLYDFTGTFEYCDYFVLSTYGDLAGGLHDFASCDEPNVPTGGSYAYLTNNVVVMGTSTGSLIGETGRSLLTTENDGVTLNYYFNFNQSVWSLYVTDGTTGLELDNVGLFTLVPLDPLAGQTVPRPASKTPSTTKYNQ